MPNNAAMFESVTSDDELLEDLRRVGEELDGVPTMIQYRVHGTHSDSKIKRRFGSWVDGLKAAGFDVPEQQAKPHYRALREAAKE